jgi:hypothetical protein
VETDQHEGKNRGMVPSGLMRLIRWCGRLALWCLILVTVLWCALALHYSNLPASLRPWAVLIFVVAAAALLFQVKPRRRGKLAYLVLALGIFSYWELIPPSNDRHWRKDVSVLPWAEVDGNHVTVHNIRNSEYRSPDDFDLRHYDRTFDLDKLKELDFFMCFWAPMPFCHTMLTFGFDDGKYLCVSIETRPEEHEGYSVTASCFKQYELIYVAGDERDLVRLRTNFRDEAVYLYHIQTTPAAMRWLFLRYCDRMNDLRARPEWYRIILRNCTTDIPRRDGGFRTLFPESWEVILNGFVDRFLYREGSLDQSLPLIELRKVGHIDTRARNADQDPDFSKRIRERIPDLLTPTGTNAAANIELRTPNIEHRMDARLSVQRSVFPFDPDNLSDDKTF